MPYWDHFSSKNPVYVWLCCRALVFSLLRLYLVSLFAVCGFLLPLSVNSVSCLLSFTIGLQVVVITILRRSCPRYLSPPRSFPSFLYGECEMLPVLAHPLASPSFNCLVVLSLFFPFFRLFVSLCSSHFAFFISCLAWENSSSLGTKKIL